MRKTEGYRGHGKKHKMSFILYTTLAMEMVLVSIPSFAVGSVGFPTVGTAAYWLILPPCFESHLSPPGALRAQMSRETSGRERENYG
jgi:hypothetical protein